MPAAVKVLIEHGADTNIRSKELAFPDYRYETNGMAVFQLPKGGWTALMYAARENAMDAAAALADLKVDLNATSRPEGTTALQLAIINVHYDLASMLLDKGADPNVPDSTGMTALYAAVDMRAPGNMLTRPEPKIRDKIDALGLVKVAARAQGQSECAAEETDHRPPPEPGRRRVARRRRHGAGARVESRRPPGHPSAARRRRRRHAHAQGSDHHGDDRRERDARAEGARGRPAARRSRCRRQRVQRERADHPAQRRRSRGQLDRAVRRRPGRQTRSPGQAESDRPRRRAGARRRRWTPGRRRPRPRRTTQRADRSAACAS